MNHTQEAPTLTLYANRVGRLLHVFLSGLLLTACVTLMFGGSKILPAQEFLGFAALVGGGGVLLYTLYYAVTPIPLLRLDSTGFSYQRFPLVVLRILWEDIEDISAIRDGEKRRGKSKQRPYLRIKLSIKPEAVSAYRGRRVFSCTLPFTDLTVLSKTIVDHICRFHAVKYQDLFA